MLLKFTFDLFFKIQGSKSVFGHKRRETAGRKKSAGYISLEL